MSKKSWAWIVLCCVCALVMTAGACQCEPPVGSDGNTNNEVIIGDDGKVITPSDRPTVGPDGAPLVDEPTGCAASWTVQMMAEQAGTVSYAVFCPPPTITGCHALEDKKDCTVADTPLIRFTFDGTKYAVEHSGSIEENSHGKLVSAPDATQPDRVTDLPANTKITALFSGISISFQFAGDKVTVFAPK